MTTTVSSHSSFHAIKQIVDFFHCCLCATLQSPFTWTYRWIGSRWRKCAILCVIVALSHTQTLHMPIQIHQRRQNRELSSRRVKCLWPYYCPMKYSLNFHWCWVRAIEWDSASLCAEETVHKWFKNNRKKSKYFTNVQETSTFSRASAEKNVRLNELPLMIIYFEFHTIPNS